MLSAHRRRAVICGRLAALTGLVLLAGCTAPTSQTASIFGQLLGPPPAEEQAPAPTPVAAAPAPEPERGGCGSAAECKKVLKTMIESPDRGWIGQRPSPDAYANGTRLFAYRALRRQLTCSELNMAVDELSTVTQTLGRVVSGMSPDQASRTRALCGQVQGELSKEREGRCRT